MFLLCVWKIRLLGDVLLSRPAAFYFVLRVYDAPDVLGIPKRLSGTLPKCAKREHFVLHLRASSSALVSRRTTLCDA